MSVRRVVITGMGAVTPLGSDVASSWDGLIAGKSAIRSVARFDVSDLPSRVAADVLYKTESDDGFFDPLEYMSARDIRRVDPFIVLGIAAADQAINDSGWSVEKYNNADRVGVLIGSGVGGLPGIEESVLKLDKEGFRKVSPFFIPATLINLLPGQVSIRHKMTGLNCSVVTACATGAHAIGEAARLIKHNYADMMVAGGAESAMCRMSFAGFAAGRALSTKFNDTPERASRPWDEDRDGFVIGEGAGVLFLEEYESAKKRNAKIYAEIVGYGVSSDAFHITAPPDNGVGGLSAMKSALKEAGISPDDVDYINAHGTSTPVGDSAEISAIKELFDFDNRTKTLYMSSIKSAIGHLLGAAGGVEAIASVMSLCTSQLPPTLNLEKPIFSHRKLDLLAKKSKNVDVRYVLSNSFGFGGTNASLLMKKVD